MERPNPKITSQSRPDELFDSVAHLARRFIRKSDGQNAIRRDLLVGEQMGDAIGNRPCLAATSACEYKQGSRYVSDGLSLGLIELRIGHLDLGSR